MDTKDGDGIEAWIGLDEKKPNNPESIALPRKYFVFKRREVEGKRLILYFMSYDELHIIYCIRNSYKKQIKIKIQACRLNFMLNRF